MQMQMQVVLNDNIYKCMQIQALGVTRTKVPPHPLAYIYRTYRTLPLPREGTFHFSSFPHPTHIFQ